MNSIFRKTQLLTIAIVASSLVIVGCKTKDKEVDEKAKAATTATSKPEGITLTTQAVARYGITFEKVSETTLGSSISAPARISFNPNSIAKVGSLVAGRVVDIKVSRGDTVAKDAELFIVESTELGEAQSDYLLKKTTLDAASQAVGPLQASADRARGLLEKEGISIAEVQKREAELRTAQSAQQLAQGAMAASERKLSLLGLSKSAIEEMAKTGTISPRHVVRAPIAGQIIDRDLATGQFIAPDKDSPILLADLSSIWVLADISESQASDVTLDSQARITIPHQPDFNITTKVSYISPVIDPATRSIQIKLEVTGQQAKLKPGGFAMVEFLAPNDKSKTQKVLVVSESAIQIINGQTCVFEVEHDQPNTFIKKPVAIGAPVGGMVPVLSGLDVGDEIVKTGSFILKAEALKSTVHEE